MKSLYRKKSFILTALLSLSLFAFVSLRESYAKKCPPGHRWVPAHKAMGGKMFKGHCKPIAKGKILKKSKKRCPDGFVFAQGVCKPVDKLGIKQKCPEGEKWIPGHKAPGGKWIVGKCKTI